MIERSKHGEIIETLELLRGRRLPEPVEKWGWVVAPFGEAVRDSEFVHRARGYIDLKRAMNKSLDNDRTGSAT